MSGANTTGLVFNLENLRSGEDYDAEITITDRFGMTSEIKQVSFKTTGALSGIDTAIHPVSGYGQVLAIWPTQVYISVGNSYSAERYNLVIRDSQGNTGLNVTMGYNCTFTNNENGILVSGFSTNSHYTYTLTSITNGALPPVSGSFQTATSNDGTYPQNIPLQGITQTPTSIFLAFTPSENLRTFMFILTDQVTQAVRSYCFFDLVGGILKYFLLNGLDSGRLYAIKYIMIDTCGNYRMASWLSVGTNFYDETPPAITSNTLTQRTATTAKLHLVTSELLNKLRIRYRIIGTTQWTEQTLAPSTTSFDVNISGLLSGQAYEYQYILDDNSGNQYLTEWVRV